ncbi:MAG: hypothetical protein AAGG48_15610 [Planctomycetota bacterium]
MRAISLLLCISLGCILILHQPVIAVPQHDQVDASRQEKLDPPTEEQRLEVLGLLTEVYRSEYVEAKTAESKGKLAKKILATAKQTKNPVECYAMLRLSADIAVQAGEAVAVIEAIDAMDARYEIDVDALRLSALKETVKRITVRTESDTLEVVIQFVESAIERNDFAPAIDLLSESVRFFREPESRRSLERLATRAGALLSQFEGVSNHVETLKENPDDPDANLAVGKFRCFGRSEWTEGLQNLVKGSDVRLKLLATWELAGKKEATDDLKIADGWWAYSDTVDGEEAVQSKLRAGSFYTRAAKTLQGLQQAKASARAREAKLLGELPSLEAIADADPNAMPMAFPP